MASGLVRQLDIEKLLHWAFRDELPKQAMDWTSSAGISPMFRLADLGTRVDDWSREPGFPTAVGPPHPDSLVVEREVMALELFKVDWPKARPTLMGSLAGLLSDNDVTLSALTIGRPGLVAMHARMGTRPRWDMTPLPEPIVGRNGKPVVQYVGDDGRLVEGRRNKHLGAGARSPLMWFPAPREVAYGRLEYSVWHGALVELARNLSSSDNAAGRCPLADHLAMAPAAPAKPWRDF